MKHSNRPPFRLSIVAAFGMLIAFGIPMSGQEAPLQKETSAPKQTTAAGPMLNEVVRQNIEDWTHDGRGRPEDWSHHHLVFSNPGTEEQAIENGTDEQWLGIVNEPRYIMQQLKRGAARSVLEADGISPEPVPLEPVLVDPGVQPRAARLHRKSKMTIDWNETLLGGTVLPNSYPAKFSFSTTTYSCTSDYVVYPTGTTGSGTTATIVAYNNLYSGCGGTVPSVYWAYNTGGGAVTTSPTLSQDGTQVAFIQVASSVASLVLVKWKETISSNATPTVGFTQNTANITFSSGALTQSDVGSQISCTATGCTLPSNDTIASVTSSTTGTLTSNFTGTTGSYATTVHTETLALPGVPTVVTNANYPSCTAPCMTTIALNGSPNDTWSAPFYDYSSDGALYVGDNSAKLHKFVGVFNSSPNECTSSYTTSPCPSSTVWPLTLGSSALGSPVYDAGSGCVFVGSTTGGILYSVQSGLAGGSACTNNTGGSTTIFGKSSTLVGSDGVGIYDAPLVDSTAQKVYVFVGTTAAQSSGCTTANDNCVYQFATNFTSGVGSSEELGSGTSGAQGYMFAGTFDNIYYTSSSGSDPSGNLYAMGNTGSGSGTLYRVPISGNAMGTPVSVATNLGGNVTGADASPITEFCDNGTSACTASAGTDFIYFSVQGGVPSAPTTSCATAYTTSCILAYKVTSALGTGSTPSSNAEMANTYGSGCWVSSGLIIDNAIPSGTEAGASNVYFTLLSSAATGQCGHAGTGDMSAIQVSQTL